MCFTLFWLEIIYGAFFTGTLTEFIFFASLLEHPVPQAAVNSEDRETSYMVSFNATESSCLDLNISVVMPSMFTLVVMTKL